LDKLSSGFGLSVAIVILFNTILGIAKEVYHPLNIFMGHLSGNHWATQGILDVVLFILLGFIFSRINFDRNFKNNSILKIILFSTLISVAGLIFWFIKS
jgi:hypothetical protein